MAILLELVKIVSSAWFSAALNICRQPKALKYGDGWGKNNQRVRNISTKQVCVLNKERQRRIRWP
jgi:hypothetical protein